MMTEDRDGVDSSSRGLIASRFRLGGLLGTGGSASVFEAFDVVTGRTVAVKLLHPHLSDTSALREAFISEAERARSLHHPQVVEILGVGTHESADETLVWIAQELAPGTTLAEHVRIHGPLSVSDTLTLGELLLDALSAAHAIGLVHRDVSPSNLMVEIAQNESATVRLLDFGLSDVAGATTLGSDVLRSSSGSRSVGVVGNVNVASPEQLRGEPVDERGDIYQAGVVLYFALTGRYPFAATDREATMRAHLHSPPPVPSVRAPGVPAGLDRVVVRAMLKDPDDRFADARSMRAALAVVAREIFAPREMTSLTRLYGTATSTVASEPRIAHPHEWEAASSRRDGVGWGVGVAVVGLLAAIAIAVPLLAPSSGTVPTPGSSPEAGAQTASPTPEPTITSVAAQNEPSPVIVPPLGPLRDVTANLQRIGLTVGTIVYLDSAYAADIVFQSEPSSGSAAAVGSAVRLSVASGMNSVPVVSGLTAKDSLSAVAAAGFDAREVTVESSDVPAGTVVGTEPEQGARLAVGSAVRVLSSMGPRQVAASPSPTATATSPSPTPTSSPSDPNE